MSDAAAPLTFTPVARVRWPTDAVAQGAQPLGFVSLLPEGLWLAYRADGSVGRADSQAAAGALLAHRVASPARTRV
jgi:hypothetical protein